MTTILDVAEAVGQLASELTDIQTVYTRPTFSLSRRLPAITVLYDGFDEDPSGLVLAGITYKFEMTIYYALEGRDIESLWEKICHLAQEVVTKFNKHKTLNDTVLKSSIVSGRPIIDVPTTVQAKPKWIGHSFKLQASVEEIVS